MKKYLLTILVFLFTLNVNAQVDSISCKACHYKTRKFDIAIFKGNYRIFSQESFIPTHFEILKAEYTLNKYLSKLNTNMDNQSKIRIIHQNLDQYFRQYFGYTDQNGDKILWINCVKKDYENEFHPEWLMDVIYVNDGGINYWNVKFNLNKRKLFGLHINGEA